MKYLSYINCFLVVLAILAFGSTNGRAQDVMKIDSGKTGGKFADWVNKQHENYQNTVEQISESQFATFVGDGIKAAKNGIAFAKEQYNAVMEAKDAVMNSTEYKAAMLSKQIAEEGKVLKDLQEEQKTKAAELKANAELERTTLEEKAKAAQENIETSRAVYQEELKNAATDAEKEQIEKEMAALSQSGGTEDIDEQIKKIESDLEAQLKQNEIEFATDIYNQGEKIADLTLQLKELLEADKKEKGSGETDPDKVIEEAMDDLSFKEGEAVSLQDRKDKEKKRQSRVKSSLMAAMSSSVGQITSTDNTKEQQESVSETSETLNGKSETIQLAIENTVNQLDALQNYLMIELKAIEARTTLILSQNKDYKAGKATSSIDICTYSGEKGGIMGAVDKAKSLKDQASGAVAKVQSGVSKVTSAVEDAKEMKNQVTDGIAAVKEAGGSIGNSVADVKNLGGGLMN